MTADATAQATSDTPVAGKGTSRTIAAVLGNLLETYDFAVYGYFAAVISPLFFPAGSATASLLLAVATFGVGFVMRPVGAIVLGSLADRRGRKAALSMTIWLMAAGTAMIGLAPTYESIGVFAPLLILVARLLQGFSAGGEVGSATAFLIEHAPPARRGLHGSWQQATQAAGLLFGSLVGAGVTGLLDKPDLQSWGWRVPFLLGLLIGPIGVYIRSKTDEPADFVAAADKARSPLRTALRDHRRAIVAGFGITITWTVCTYFFLIYMPTFASRELGVASGTALLVNAVSLVVILVLAPVFGAWSDRVGRRGPLLGSAAAVAVLTYPALALLTSVRGVLALVLFQLVFATIVAVFTGIAPAAIAELCPPEVRSTGFSIAYNFAVTIFGGFAPFIATWLIAASGSRTSPAWYVVGAVALSVALIASLYRSRPA
jgi:MHS family proline/betaine transporter-like MFS transporter